MSLRNTQSHWGLVTRLFHWLMAIAILVMIAVGVTMINLPTSPLKIDMFKFHKSLGMLLLLLALLRLFWRFTNPVPLLPDYLPQKEKFLVHAGQYVMYGLLIFIPLSGWIINSAANIPMQWFGLFVVPPIVGPSIEMEDYAKTAHLTFIIILGIILCAHIGAALRHHYINKNNILMNMLGKK
ncbi:MAG: cytochrome b [Pseudomonadota bacterium]